MLLSVMDLGSNSFKMTVAQWAPELNRKRPFQVLHKERHPIQLGASVFKDGKISQKDFRDAFKAVAKMQARLRDFSAPILRIVATSAIRDSRNGQDFVKEVKKDLGLSIEVITGAQEAQLISHGLAFEYPHVSRGLLIDIGGGSTEVCGFGKGWRRSSLYCQSFRMGSVRLAMQAFAKGAKPELEGVRKLVRQQLRGAAPRFEKLVGSAGTIQTLGQILGRPGPGGATVIRKSVLDDWIERHLHDSRSHLLRTYRIQPSRARVIVPGAVVLSEFLAWLGAKELAVTGMTLRDGVMVDLVQQWENDQSALLKSKAPVKTTRQAPASERELLKALEEAAARFHVDLPHARHVAALSLSIFDQLGRFFPKGFFQAEERRFLLAAAYLHDAGKAIALNAHHKHSAYLIRHVLLPGFNSLDSKKAAALALHHRKEPPPKRDPVAFNLRGVHAEQVRRGSAILRLADCLDEGHLQDIRSLHLRVAKKQLFLELMQSRGSAKIGALSPHFRERAAYFEELFGLRIVSFIHHNPSH